MLRKSKKQEDLIDEDQNHARQIIVPPSENKSTQIESDKLYFTRVVSHLFSMGGIMSAEKEGLRKLLHELIKKNTPVEPAALHLLVQSEANLDLVREILNKQLVDVNANVNSKTALHFAMNESCYNMTKLLLEFGASIDQVRQISKDWFFKESWVLIANEAQQIRENRLRTAAFRGDLGDVKRMLSWGVSPDTADPSKGETPLLMAALADATEVMQVLIGAHANVNLTNHSGTTPLITAAYNGKTSAVRLLLANTSTNVNAFQIDGLNALGYAANVEILNLLLADSRIKVNAFHPGFTKNALMGIVLSNNRPLLIALLKARGLNIHLENTYKETAKTFAKAGALKNKDFSALLDEVDTRDFQLFTIFERHDQYFAEDIKNLNLQEQNNEGENALLVAIRRGNVPLVLWLLQEGGMSLKEEDNHGTLPMEHAIKHGKTEVVQTLLLTFKIDINQKYGKNGLTAILLAAQHDQPDVIIALQKMGAYLDFRDENGRTALFTSVLNGRQQVIDSLLNAGAASDLIDNEGKTAFDVAKSVIARQALLYHQTKNCRHFPTNLNDYFKESNPDICPIHLSYVLSLSRAKSDVLESVKILQAALPTDGKPSEQDTLLRACMQQFGFRDIISSELANVMGSTKYKDATAKASRATQFFAYADTASEAKLKAEIVRLKEIIESQQAEIARLQSKATPTHQKSTMKSFE